MYRYLQNFGSVPTGNFMDLKNDEDRLEYALKFLIRNVGKIDIEVASKNAKKATEYIDKGNRKFQLLPWLAASELYTKGVVYAPPDSSELARAYANRSATLYHGRQYEDCILDIKRALDIGYADELKAKLYTRKAQCLLALRQKMCPEVHEAAADARKWIEKMSANNRGNMNYILNKLHLQSPMKPYKKKDSSHYLPDIPSDNPKIKGASASIELQYSQKYGRHVVATRNIRAGEAILVHKHYASIVHSRLFHKSCWNCSKIVWASVPCHQCVSVVYCDENCREMAWQEHHDIECPVITAMLGAEATYYQFLCLRLTVKAFKEAGTLKKLKENVERIDSIQDPITKSFSGDMHDNTKYSSIYTLYHGSVTQFEQAEEAAISLYFLGATTEIFGKKIDNIRDLLCNKWAIFVGGVIMRHVRICKINNSAMVYDNDDEPRRHVIMPFVSLFNHSCDPMVAAPTSGSTTAVVAIQMIKKGEQIFMNYDHFFQEKPTDERRMHLLNSFNFRCECVACINDWGPNTTFSPREIRDWPTDIQKQMIRIKAKNLEFSAYKTVNIEDQFLFISITQSMINFVQPIQKYPTKQIINLKKYLFNLYGSISD